VLGELTLSLLLLAGCGSMAGPEHRTAQVDNDLPERWQTEPTVAETALEQPFFSSLADLLRQPRLVELLREAQRANPDLQQLALQLQASGLLLKPVAARRYPTLDLSGNTTRSYRDNSHTNSYEFGLSSAWELDLWGKLADQLSAVQFADGALAQDYAAARNTLAVRILRTWVEAWSLQARRTNQRNQIDALEQIAAVVLDSYRAGGAALEDLSVVRLEQQYARADLLATTEALARNRRTLHLLLGRMPTTAQLIDERPLPDIVMPPAQLPARVLARRPDIQAAFQRLQALDAQTRASYKALLPSINLSGNLGRSATPGALSHLFGGAGEGVWALVGGISQPLFRAGSLRTEAQAASVSAEGGWWAYRQTLLNAVLEVENGLAMEQSLSQQLQLLQTAQQQALRLQHVYEEKYRNGLVDILGLIDARLKLLESTARLIQTRAARLDNRLLLAQALGFGVETNNDGI
jgi:NodT family efflux transporter outer membrane factor (OMF) lipoprotein